MAGLVVVDEFDDVLHVLAGILEEWQLSNVLQRQVQGMSSAVNPRDMRVPAIHTRGLEPGQVAAYTHSIRASNSSEAHFSVTSLAAAGLTAAPSVMRTVTCSGPIFSICAIHSPAMNAASLV